MTARVIFIDDEVDFLNIQYEFFKHRYNVERYSDGTKFLDDFKCSESPTVLILDLMMPMISGDKVASKVKKQFGDKVKVLLLTAKQYVPSCELENVDLLLHKPVNFGLLGSSIEQLVEN